MYLAKITFGSHVDKSSHKEELKDEAETYLSALLRVGQIYGDYFVAWHHNILTAYTHVARLNSLAKKYHSRWGLSSLESVIELFGQAPECEIIDDDIPKRFPSWKKSSSLYLFSHAFNEGSPLYCGDSGSPIPQYLLPLPEQTLDYVYFWSRAYYHHDHIWLNSATLEIPAYKQLADPQSELSVNGRQLCAEIEQATNKPTYYYMQRYWGRNVKEATRRCPLCGGKWHTSTKTNEDKRFHQFQFRCKKCRLVSHSADSFEDERHARIGEYKKNKHS